jgi:hypothetical protein
MPLIEYWTGQDSFSARGSIPGRTVSLTAMVYNTRSGLFENPRSLTNGGDVCKVDKVHKAMPASTVLAASAGNWYCYRTQVRSGSLWAFELRKKSVGMFSYDTETLLVRFYQKAPLMRVKLLLPEHPFANVPELDLVWNAQRIHDSTQLGQDELNAFKKLTGETSDFVVSVTQDPVELASWEFTEIEKAAPKVNKLVRSASRAPVAINRVKRLRLT